MFQRFVNLLQRLWARLSWTGGVHYLNGGPGLPPPLTPEEEKALLARMADGDPAARDELITHNLRLVPSSTSRSRRPDSTPSSASSAMRSMPTSRSRSRKADQVLIF